MQISKKADYALRAVVILASLPPGKTMQTQEMAKTGEIPTKFLEQILLVLKRSGLLKSKRGVGGGYQLARESRHISLANVVESIDGELCNLVDADDYPGFPGSSGLTSSLKRAQTLLNQHLSETSIEDLLTDGDDGSMVGYGI